MEKESSIWMSKDAWNLENEWLTHKEKQMFKFGLSSWRDTPEIAEQRRRLILKDDEDWMKEHNYEGIITQMKKREVKPYGATRKQLIEIVKR